MARRWQYTLGASLLLIIAGAALVAGCSSSPGPSPASSTPAGTSGGISLSKQIQPIFNDNCVICHQGASAPVNLSLEPDQAYKNLVNVKSTESPLMRVAPGAPDKSYIINKLMGTQAQAGGSGAMMPLGAPSLSQAQIGLIQQWITQGTPNN